MDHIEIKQKSEIFTRNWKEKDVTIEKAVKRTIQAIKISRFWTRWDRKRKKEGC
jgi:hypothetical protein